MPHVARSTHRIRSLISLSAPSLGRGLLQRFLQRKRRDRIRVSLGVTESLTREALDLCQTADSQWDDVAGRQVWKRGPEYGN